MLCCFRPTVFAQSDESPAKLAVETKRLDSPANPVEESSDAETSKTLPDTLVHHSEDSRQEQQDAETSQGAEPQHPADEPCQSTASKVLAEDRPAQNSVANLSSNAGQEPSSVFPAGLLSSFIHTPALVKAVNSQVPNHSHTSTKAGSPAITSGNVKGAKPRLLHSHAMMAQQPDIDLSALESSTTAAMPQFAVLPQHVPPPPPSLEIIATKLEGAVTSSKLQPSNDQQQFLAELVTSRWSPFAMMKGIASAPVSSAPRPSLIAVGQSTVPKHASAGPPETRTSRTLADYAELAKPA